MAKFTSLTNVLNGKYLGILPESAVVPELAVDHAPEALHQLLPVIPVVSPSLKRWRFDHKPTQQEIKWQFNAKLKFDHQSKKEGQNDLPQLALKM